MSTTDYIIDVALILIIAMRIKEQPLSVRALIRPFIFIGIAAAIYLRGVPTGGNDLPLVALFALLGGAIGSMCGFAMRMRRGPQCEVLVSAGPAAVFYWVLGMGGRFALIFWLTHSGSETVGKFSFDHGITGADAWTVAILTMAFAEVAMATVVQALRGRRIGTIEGTSSGRRLPNAAR